MKIQLTNNLKNFSKKCVVGEHHNYLMNHAKISHSNILTENINACVAGVISAGKTNMMFHLDPDKQGLKNLENIFYQKMDKFFETAKTNNFDAVITGGWGCTAPDITTAYKSIKLYNKVAELIEDLKGRLSIFCGKEQNDIDDLHFDKNGCTSLASPNWSKFGIDINNIKNITPEEAIKLLESKYETVEIHPSHIFIG